MSIGLGWAHKIADRLQTGSGNAGLRQLQNPARSDDHLKRKPIEETIRAEIKEVRAAGRIIIFERALFEKLRSIILEEIPDGTRFAVIETISGHASDFSMHRGSLYQR